MPDFASANPTGLTPAYLRIRRRFRANPSSIPRRENPATMGVRRYRRWLNKTYLKEQEIYIESEDLVVFDSPNTHFSSLFEEPGKGAFQPFLEVSEDEQHALLLSISALSINETITISSKSGIHNLDKKDRKIIQKFVGTDLLLKLDEQLFKFIQDKEDQSPRKLKFEDSFQRLLCHTVCRFYCLNSQSIDTNEGRTVVIKKSKDIIQTTKSLSEFLSL